MHENYQSTPKTHLVRIAVALGVLLLVGLLARVVLLPKSFGKYGHYRADAIKDEMNREVRHMTNDSCLACHSHIKEVHLDGVHKTVSCEFCHGPLADHVKDGKKIGTLPVKKKTEITDLCLRCHNQIIRARPTESIKMVSAAKHLEDKHVRLDHTCDQCHNVHAPLMWVNMAKEMVGVTGGKKIEQEEAK